MLSSPADNMRKNDAHAAHARDSLNPKVEAWAGSKFTRCPRLPVHQVGFGLHLDSVDCVLLGGGTVTVGNVVVDLVRFELTTSSMPWKRAPNCATGPRGQLY